jgi:hypothetical protein
MWGVLASNPSKIAGVLAVAERGVANGARYRPHSRELTVGAAS